MISLLGCVERQSYYLSPQNANSNPYRAIPMKADSLKSAIYMNGVFSTGSANDRAADHVTAFQGSFLSLIMLKKIISPASFRPISDPLPIIFSSASLTGLGKSDILV